VCIQRPPGSSQTGRRDSQLDSIIKCTYTVDHHSTTPTATAAKSQYLTHLRVAHKNERPSEQQINNLSEPHNIHVLCPSCPHIQPYNTGNALNKHINAHTPPTSMNED